MTMDVRIDYQHRHSAHCENGVTSGLLSHHGLEISESMAFGIGSGLFFGYAPFIKIGSLPMTTFRTMPGQIFKKAARRLGITVESDRFRNQEKATAALDRHLLNGNPVACQTGAYWLPYFPEGMRFHFNMHNIVVYGKQGSTYLVSDPVMDEPVTCDQASLLEARFAKGPMAPRGHLYFPRNVPPDTDLRPAVIAGIKDTCFAMLTIPIIFAGISGIRLLGRRMAGWPDRLGLKQASRCLGTVIRMQEEIGTGGAGFRFIYAAFLQETGQLFDEPEFDELSEQLTNTGDQWREFARLGARNCKRRATAEESYDKLGEILGDCADREELIFRRLRALARRLA